MCWFCNAKAWAFSGAARVSQGAWAPRRAFLLAAGAAATEPALAQVNVGKASNLRRLVPAEALEQSAAQEYVKTLAQAQQKGVLAADNDPQTQRLRQIAGRLIAHTSQWNGRASQWQWEVNLIKDRQINAWCMPGGKIAFYTGILDQLKLSDDECAMVMGHEMAHALREHAREQLAKTQATGIGLSVAAQLFGLGQLGSVAADLGTQLLRLKYSRDDETEADLVGLEIGARSAYAPSAAVNLWNKMLAAGGGNGPGFLSSHPSGPDRINQLSRNVPKVEGLYQQALRGTTASRALARAPASPAASPATSPTAASAARVPPGHRPVTSDSGVFQTPVGQAIGSQ